LMKFMVLGLMVFSPVSSLLSMSFLHLPLALPELFFLPFYFLLQKKIRSVQLKSRSVFKVIYLLIIMLLCALFSANFSLFAILSNARAWLYLFLSFCIFRYDNDITYDDILYLALGSIIGWGVVCLYTINRFILFGDYHVSVTYGLMLSLPLFYSIAIYKKEKVLLMIGFIMTMVIIIFSGTRRVILVTTLSIIVPLIVVALIRKKNIFLYSIASLIVFVVVYTTVPTIENVVKEISPHLHFRLFTRTESLITGGLEASDDLGRLGIITSTYDEMLKSCLPNGFISMQTATDDNTGHYNDYPFSMLMWIFSWPLAFLILLYAIIITMKNIRVVIKTEALPPLVSTVCLLTILFLLFLDGSFLTYAYATPITGAVLAISVKTAKQRHYN